MKLITSLLGLATVAARALAVPTSATLPTKDAPFSIDATTLKNAVTCPDGIQGKAGGIVLLVPGTALNGQDSYESGPYRQLLPKEGPGFDVCWVDIPNRGLGDAQIGAEYVAYNAIRLAKQSATKTVKLVGHSQGGGLNIPWALIFWPSARAVVEDFVGLAPDFHGTTLLPYPVCAVEDVLSVGKGCSASILQQEKGSNYLNAQLSLLKSALVPTTVIFTRTDEIVIPQFGPETSSRLPGSSQFPLQDLDVCGPLHVADHLSMLIDPAAYAIAVQAFTKKGAASLKEFDRTSCFNFRNTALGFDDVLPALRFSANLGLAVLDSGGSYAQEEPPLKQYVCDAGAATNCAGGK